MVLLPLVPTSIPYICLSSYSDDYSLSIQKEAAAHPDCYLSLCAYDTWRPPFEHQSFSAAQFHLELKRLTHLTKSLRRLMSQPIASRTALQPLAAKPMNKCIVSSATSDSHLNTLCESAGENAAMKGAGMKAKEALTPPITPSSSGHVMKPNENFEIPGTFTADSNCEDVNSEPQFVRTSDANASTFSDTTARPYLGTYQIDPDPLLGHGAWSTVRRATKTHSPAAAAMQKSSSFLVMTPPSSPQSKGHSSSAILAIKSPSRRDAQPILLHEARILTYLHRHSAAFQHLLGFHGWDAPNSSLVLTAYPQTLDQYVKGVDTSSLSPIEPAVGRNAWIALVRNLVSALIFLHEAKCVHGDIKPSNVLLSFESTDSIQPLLADFSSSHIMPPDGDTSQIPEVSATTAEYTSPELLTAMLPKDPRRAVASFANDVYGLGVTLLEAATGQKTYATAKGFMKLTMAREGRVVEFMSAESRRVGKGVRGLIGGACTGKEENRWNAEKWVQIVAEGWRD